MTNVEVSPGGIGFVYVNEPQIADGIPVGTRFRDWAEKHAPEHEASDIKPSSVGLSRASSGFKIRRDGNSITVQFKSEAPRPKRAKTRSKHRSRTSRAD